MTVAEFIAELSKFPPNMLILSFNSRTGLGITPKIEVHAVTPWEADGEFVISSSILRDPDRRDAVLI